MGKELEWRRRRQSGRRLVVVMVGIAEVSSYGKLISHNVNLVFDSLYGLIRKKEKEKKA